MWEDRHPRDFQLPNNKILDKIYRHNPWLFISSAISFVNAFVSNFYFYINTRNTHTRVILWNTHLSVVKKCERQKQILITRPSVTKICFNGKDFPWDQVKLNKFNYIKNVAVTICICLQNCSYQGYCGKTWWKSPMWPLHKCLNSLVMN